MQAPVPPGASRRCGSECVVRAQTAQRGCPTYAGRKRIAEDLIDEADDARVLGSLVEIAVVLAVVRDDLETFLLFEQVERVRADAEMFFDLALERMR